MPIAENHLERVAGLATMAAVECEGDMVAAFAALLDASVAVGLEAGVRPDVTRKRLQENYAKTIASVDEYAHLKEQKTNG